MQTISKLSCGAILSSLSSVFNPLCLSLAFLLSSCNSNQQQTLKTQNQIVANSLTVDSAQDYNFSDVAYGNGTYLIVGNNGAMYISKDSREWSKLSAVTNNNINSIAFNKVRKLFYAVGDDGLLLSSADGKLWTQYQPLSPRVRLNIINMLDDGNFIIGGDSGNIFDVVLGNTANEDRIIPRKFYNQVGAVDNSPITAAVVGGTYMVAGNFVGLSNVKDNNVFITENWRYHGKLQDDSISDIAYNKASNYFHVVLKGGLVSNLSGKKSTATWTHPVCVAHKSFEKCLIDATTNSIAADPSSEDLLVVGGGSDSSNTFIAISEDSNSWDKVTIPNIYKLNKIRCFGDSESSYCLAVGDKKSVVISRIINDKLVYDVVNISEPAVKSFEPNNNAINVNTNPLMVLSFNKTVNNVNNSTVMLSQDGTSSTEVKLSNFEPSRDRTSYTFRTSYRLNDNTRYQLNIKAGIKDDYGNELERNDYSFSFTTGNVSYPEVKSIIPADGESKVYNIPNFEVLFNEPVLNLNTQTVILYENTPARPQVPITNPTRQGDSGYVFAPVTKLKVMTSYCVSFTSGITDIYGVKIKEYTSCFKTSDYIAPTVTMIKPEDNAIDTSIMPELRFQFSKSVIGVTTDNVILHEGSPTGAVVKIDSIIADDNTYTAQLGAALKVNTNYYLVMSSGIKDKADEDNALPNTIFTFRTRDTDIIAFIAGNKCIYGLNVDDKLSCNQSLSYAMYDATFDASYNKYFAVGSSGVAYSSSNGKNWSLMSTGAKNSLRAIAILNSNAPYLVAVGDKGTIVASNDMGQTWSLKTVTPAITKDLTNIYSDGVHFFIAIDGDEWLYSEDGGQTWSRRTDIAKLPTGNQNFFVSNGKNYLIGGDKGIVYASSDNMKSWIQQTSVLYKPVGKVSYSSFNEYVPFKDYDINLLLGNDNTMFIASNDGAVNNQWTRIKSFDNNVRENFLSASADSNGDIYMTTSTGKIYMSVGGVYWGNIANTTTADSLNKMVSLDQ